MFIPDRPIEKEEDDFLGRDRFSQELGKRLTEWKQKDSLVVALYGKWGVGKSSILNLTRQFLYSQDKSLQPFVIDFNPWRFSEFDNLNEQFFDEISKVLLKSGSWKYKAISNKLKLYSKALESIPERNNISNLFILLLGFLGIAFPAIGSIFIDSNFAKYTSFVLGLILIIPAIIKGPISWLSEYYTFRAQKMTVSELKRNIAQELIAKETKLLIIIDDVDRLDQKEIKQIFTLIRVNADFPNTIYLLAFDRSIIENNLKVLEGVSGKEFLEKIVQVGFDVPYVKQHKIEKYLFIELKRILRILPKEVSDNFDTIYQTYWGNVYHSGFKSFFKNIRDVKRYIGSLEFNIGLMHQNGIMEVNPIDFFAVEAIRVFIPELYSLMKNEISLFTKTGSSYEEVYDLGNGERITREDRVKELLAKIPEEKHRLSAKELLERIFPQLKMNYGSEWQKEWRRDLRICATACYDAYFTLIPGGDEEEVSNYEVDRFLSKINSIKELELEFRDYMVSGKIRRLLEKLQDFTDDRSIIKVGEEKNIIQALFDISDDIPFEKEGMFDFGIDFEIGSIVYQLLKRNDDKGLNFDILKEAIKDSKGIYGPVDEIRSIENIIEENKEDREDIITVSNDKIDELRMLGLEKIIAGSNDEKMKDHHELLFLLYKWKRWGGDYSEYLKRITQHPQDFLNFLNRFVIKQKSLTMGDYVEREVKKFTTKSLKVFLNLEDVRKRLEEIRGENKEVFQNNKELIDFVLTEIDKPEDSE